MRKRLFGPVFFVAAHQHDVLALAGTSFPFKHDAGSRKREGTQQGYGREQFHGNRFYRVNEFTLLRISYHKSID